MRNPLHWLWCDAGQWRGVTGTVTTLAAQFDVVRCRGCGRTRVWDPSPASSRALGLRAGDDVTWTATGSAAPASDVFYTCSGN